MPDSKAGAWGAINGKEFVNSSRTIAYINNFNLPIKVDDDCWCPSIQDLLIASGCPEVTGAGPSGHYQFPSTDPAPWFDDSIPESGDFLGFLTTEFEGLGSTYARSVTETLQGGALLGKLRPQARTMTWRGFLFGRTCCAAEYGLRWLTAQLAGGVCDDCTDSELDILLCCPEVTGTEPSLSCGSPTLPQFECGTDPPVPVTSTIPAFSQSAAKDAFRTFHRVGLVDGPTVSSTRTIGCGSCEDSGGGCMIEAEFSLAAGNPFMHREPVCVCQTQPFPPCKTCAEAEADQDSWIKVNAVSYPASEEDADLCTDSLECTAAAADCNIDPNCPVSPLPEIPGFEDPCGCDAIFITETCCHIKKDDTYGSFFEGIPQITVFSGDRPLNNVHIRIYENPQERDCTDKSLFDICNLCDDINIRYVPANSSLTIDGLTKRVSVTCPGDNVQPGESLMTSSFRWPVFKCIDYIVKVSADCCAKPPVTFIRKASNDVHTNTFTGSGILRVVSTTGFPVSGTITIETTGKDKTTKKLTYTGITATTFTGVTSTGSDIVLNTNDRVVGVTTDTDCTQGVSPDATTSITIIPREM